MSVCFNVMKKANADRLNDDELKELLAELQTEKKSRQAANQLQNLEKAVFTRGELMINEADVARMIEKRSRYQNIIKLQRALALADRADKATGDPSLGFEALLVGVNAKFEGAQKSVDALNQALMAEFMGGFIADLKKAKLNTQFNNMKKDFEKEVARVLANLNQKNPLPNSKIDASEEAIAMGEIMFKYQRQAFQRENMAGAFIRLKEGRVVGASHDIRRMTKGGKEAWVEHINKKINWEKTAGGEFYLDEKISDRELVKKVANDRKAFLERSYDAITTGIRTDTERTEISKSFKGPSNLAKRESASALFTFKSADDWYEYDQQFGRASLREAFIQDISSSLRSTALMEMLGPNPEAMVDLIKKRLLEKYKSDPTKVRKLKREAAAINFEAAYKEVSGDVNLGSHTGIARTFHFMRSWQTMAKLGGAFISAFSDIAFIAANRSYQGRSMMDSWGDAFSAVFKGMNAGEMREFADRLGVGIEGQLGDFMSRFNASDDIPGQTSKLMSMFFKLNLLQPWTESNKRGVTLMIANDLGREANKSFNKLPDDLQRLLSIYDIDAAKWNKARKGAKKGPDGRTYLIPGEIEDVSLRQNFFALLVSEADNAVPSPGARERAILRRGYRPGTFAGEGIRFLTQFKSFGVTALTKPLGRQIYGYGASGSVPVALLNQLKRGVGANMGLVNAVVGTTVMGYFVMQLKEVMKGREMRPHSPETFLAAALQGGGLGIYGDFLFGEANRYGGGTLQTLSGPFLSEVSEFNDFLQNSRDALLTGEGDTRAELLRLLKRNTPFGNVFYTKQVMDYLIWYQLQEALNPGYLRRMERRVERENGTKFTIRPSSIIATGGGFR